MDEDIWSEDCYQDFMQDLPDSLACDSETSGLTWKDTAFGVSLAWRRGEELISGYIDLRHNPQYWEEIKYILKRDKPQIIGHNWKFDAHKLNLYPNRFEDTCLMVYLLSEHYPKGLKVLAEKILKETTDEADVLKRVRKELKLKISDGYDKLPLSVVAPYAIRDAEYTLRIYEKLAPKFAEDDELAEVYAMEKQLLLCVAGTERRGMGIDLEYVKAKIIELGDQILDLEREASKIVGKPVGRNLKEGQFNLDSPKQLLEYFNSKGLEVSGTSKDVLETVPDPLGKMLTEIRTLKKIRSTYLLPMVEEQVDSVLHPNWNLTRTKTLRSSSSGAND